MRLLQRADWSFGFLWAACTCVFYVLASVFVLEQNFDFDFIATNLVLWTVGGIFMALALGIKRNRAP